MNRASIVLDGSILLQLGLLALLFLVIAVLYALRYRERERDPLPMANSEARLKLSLSASGDELWTADLDSGKLQRENPIAGLRMNEVGYGETLAAVTRAVHPDDLGAFNEALDLHLKGQREMFEVVFRSRESGEAESWRWLQVHARVVSRDADGRAQQLSGIAGDVSLIKQAQLAEVRLNDELKQRIEELQRAQAAVRAGDEKLLLALWGSDSEYWETDIQHRCIERLSPLKHLATPDHAGSMAIADFHRYVHPQDLPGLIGAAFAHIKGESEDFDMIYRARRRDGRWAWLRSRGRVSQHDVHGRAERMLGITFDVSTIKQHETELMTLNEDLEQRVATRTSELSDSNIQLTRTLEALTRTQSELVQQEKLAALGGLVAGIAHEINTPLGIGVTAASHLYEQSMRLQKQLDEGAPTRSSLLSYIDNAMQSSQLVLTNLQRASALVRSFKQVAVDQTSEQRRVIDLKTCLEDILLSLRPSLRGSPHQILLDCPAQISWDTYPGALYQCVVNLLMNALQHAFEGRTQGTVRIGARQLGESVRIEVADNGNGMPDEVRGRIFEPFYTTRRGQGGSGLGLHIVFSVVTQVLGGSVECSSAPGEGACFVLLLPMTVARSATPGAPATP
jgi:signal transduction histidine kinase